MRCDVSQPRLVHDPEHLDEHRVPLGLEPAAEYDRSMRKTYGKQTSVGASGGDGWSSARSLYLAKWAEGKAC